MSSTVVYKILPLFVVTILLGHVICQHDDEVNADMAGHQMDMTTHSMDMSHHNMSSNSSHMATHNSQSNHGNMTMSGSNHGNMTMSHGNMTTSHNSHGNMTTSHNSHGNMNTTSNSTMPMNTTMPLHPGAHSPGMNATKDISSDHSGHGSTDSEKTDHSLHNNQQEASDTDESHTSHNSQPSHSQHSGLQGHYGVFHLTYDTVILFTKWTTKSWQHMLYSCLGIGVFALFYEGLKTFREWICIKTADALERKSIKSWNRISCGTHIFQMFLHMLQVLWSYLLMLVFMTFNVYLCAAVILGAGVGFLLFRWKTPANKYIINDINEHCM